MFKDQNRSLDGDWGNNVVEILALDDQDLAFRRENKGQTA